MFFAATPCGNFLSAILFLSLASFTTGGAVKIAKKCKGLMAKGALYSDRQGACPPKNTGPPEGTSSYSLLRAAGWHFTILSKPIYFYVFQFFNFFKIIMV
jgi:hypothetical protein